MIETGQLRSDAAHGPSRRRLWAFRAIAILLPFAIFALIEAALRIIPGITGDQDPYVNVSPVSIFSRQTFDGQEYYTISHPLIFNGPSVRILVKKPANTIRIFCLGASACAGWPHPPEETFSVYLQRALQSAYPSKRVEVVNAAAHGFASYRVCHVLDEVLKLQPDAVIVWAGNNEFLEDRKYREVNATVAAIARHLRTVQVVRTLFSNRIPMSGDSLKGAAKFFWSKSHQQALTLRTDPRQFALVREHYAGSLNRMVHAAQSKQVPLVFFTVPVNLHDWLPVVSANRLKGDRLAKWQEYYDLARRDLLDRRFGEGIFAMNQALAMEPDNAESWFWLGRLLEADNRKDAAWKAFSTARDNDEVPFRAISSFNDSIRSLAARNEGKGVFLLDLEHLFKEASRNSAPGFDLFLDYVHPTKPGNILIAEKAFDLIIANQVLDARPETNRFIFQDLPYGTTGRPYTDEADRRVQLTALTMAAENHQYEAAVDKIGFLYSQITGKTLTRPEELVAAHCPPEFYNSYLLFRRQLALEQREIMGQPVSGSERSEMKFEIDSFYNSIFPFGAF